MLKLELKLRQLQSRNDYGVLGNVINNCYLFRATRYKEFKVNDAINNKVVSSLKYFKRWNNGYLVNPEYLPFDSDIKAICIDKKENIIVETSPLDFGEIKKRLKEINHAVAVRGVTFYDMDGERLMKTITANARLYNRQTTFVRRTKITLLENTHANYLYLMIEVLDLIFDFSLFKVAKQPETEIHAGEAGGINTAQKLGLQQLIGLEQVPTVKMGFKIIPYLNQLSQILQMSKQELVQQINEARDDLESVRRLIYQMLRKKAIQRIKSNLPEISWGKAASLYDKIAAKI